MKGSIERTIVAHLAWRYRWSVSAYNLISSKENVPKLLMDLAYCKVDERWNAFEESRRILKGIEL